MMQKRRKISLDEIEQVMQSSRPVIIHNILKQCKWKNLIQNKHVQLKRRDVDSILNVLTQTPHNVHPHQYQDEQNEIEQWHILSTTNDNIETIPDFIQEIFEHIDPANTLLWQAFYTSFTKDVNGFWYCLLSGLDSSFIGRTRFSKMRLVLELKQNMIYELEQYFEPLHYRGYGFVKSSMLSLLQQEDVYNNSLGHYVCDFLKINIVLITPNKEMLWIAPYREDRVLLMMWKRDIHWGVIIHPDDKSHLFTMNMKPLLEQYCFNGSLIDWTRKSHIETDPTVLKQIKKELKLFKIKELIDKAEKLEIPVICMTTGKRKLKEQLLTDIFTALTGQSWNA